MSGGNVYGPVKPTTGNRVPTGMAYTSSGERIAACRSPGRYGSSLMVIASGSCGAEAIEYARTSSFFPPFKLLDVAHLTGDDREGVRIDGQELPGAVRRNLRCLENERDRVRGLLDDLGDDDLESLRLVAFGRHGWMLA